MQELIEFYKNNHPFYSYTKDDIIKVLQLYIEKEKEQIIDAYNDGHYIKDEFFNPEQYYNETYN